VSFEGGGARRGGRLNAGGAKFYQNVIKLGGGALERGQFTFSATAPKTQSLMQLLKMSPHSFETQPHNFA
jgi:hypothetical protein